MAELFKTCTKCRKQKLIIEFPNDSSKPDGKYPRCRLCKKEDRHQIYIKNPDKANQYSRQWRSKNLERVNEAAREWKNKNPQKCIIATRKYRKKYPERCKKSWQKWVNNNKEKRQAISKRSRQKRYNTIKGCLSHRISTLMNRSLGNNKKGYHWELLVSYSVDDLRTHLENKFIKGMSWDNKNLWHIDHIIPISAFNYEKPEDMDFKKCWALSNLQPLWKRDNLIKNGKVIKPFQPSLLL